METGKVRYVTRNFPFLAPESVYAAEAAEAAAAQGKYWEYRALLFQRQQGGREAFQPENLKRYAAELGLDQEAFNAALDNATYRPIILAEYREADAMGLGGVPSFFVNGDKLERVPTVQMLGELIEERLGGAR